jgi:hypothetical protein
MNASFSAVNPYALFPHQFTGYATKLYTLLE